VVPRDPSTSLRMTIAHSRSFVIRHSDFVI
jgi:hypothetical protein